MDAGLGGGGASDGHGADAPGLRGAHLLGAMLEHLTEVVFVVDRERRLKAMLGPPGGLLGRDPEVASHVFEHLHPDELPRGLVIEAGGRPAGEAWETATVVRMRDIDGTMRRCAVRFVDRFDDPAVEGMVVHARLIDPTIEDPPEGPGIEDHGAADLPTAYLALGAGGVVRHASTAACELLDADQTDLRGLPVAELVVDRDRPLISAAYAALLRTTGARTVLATTRARFGGRPVEAEFHTRGTDPDHKVVTVVLVDRSEEPELVRLATRDPLTGLANRTVVMQTIGGLLLEPEPTLSVVYVDLDDLKGINDHHGHEAGDDALVAVADHLRSQVRPDDLVGRMSGDEFVVVCPGMEAPALLGFVERVGAVVPEVATILAPDGSRLTITVSAGGASAVAGDTTTTLLRRADEAMFLAKHARRS